MLIGSAVYIGPEELGINRIVKDEHYDRSTLLVSALKGYVKKRIGVFTQTLSNQAHNTLRSVVIECLEREGCDRQNESLIHNNCADRLERTLEILVREPIDEEAKNRLLVKVGQMHAHLRERAGLTTTGALYEVAEKRAEGRASPGYRKYVLGDEIQRLRRERLQLTTIMNDPPNPRDCEIQAEAAALKESYSEEAPTDVYVASADSHHFSPMRFEDGSVSDQVTRQIEETLGVKCDWPERIAAVVKSA